MIQLWFILQNYSLCYNVKSVKSKQLLKFENILSKPNPESYVTYCLSLSQTSLVAQLSILPQAIEVDRFKNIRELCMSCVI